MDAAAQKKAAESFVDLLRNERLMRAFSVPTDGWGPELTAAYSALEQLGPVLEVATKVQIPDPERENPYNIVKRGPFKVYYRNAHKKQVGRVITFLMQALKAYTDQGIIFDVEIPVMVRSPKRGTRNALAWYWYGDRNVLGGRGHLIFVPKYLDHPNGYSTTLHEMAHFLQWELLPGGANHAGIKEKYAEAMALPITGGNVLSRVIDEVKTTKKEFAKVLRAWLRKQPAVTKIGTTNYKYLYPTFKVTFNRNYANSTSISTYSNPELGTLTDTNAEWVDPEEYKAICESFTSTLDELAKEWKTAADAQKGGDQGYGQWRNRLLPTDYAKKNDREWFAESMTALLIAPQGVDPDLKSWLMEKSKERPPEDTSSAGVAIYTDKGILLVHPTNAAWTGTYSIPKGRPNRKESKRDAARRETQEEVGLYVPITMSRGGRLTITKEQRNLWWFTYSADKKMLASLEQGKGGLRVPKARLQLEEVDWAGIVPWDEAERRIHKDQRPIVNRCYQLALASMRRREEREREKSLFKDRKESVKKSARLAVGEFRLKPGWSYTSASENRAGIQSLDGQYRITIVKDGEEDWSAWYKGPDDSGDGQRIYNMKDPVKLFRHACGMLLESKDEPKRIINDNPEGWAKAVENAKAALHAQATRLNEVGLVNDLYDSLPAPLVDIIDGSDHDHLPRYVEGLLVDWYVQNGR